MKKRDVAHIITAAITAYMLVYRLLDINTLDYSIWSILNMSSNAIIIFLLVKNLGKEPKNIKDSIFMWLIAVLSTNFSIFVSLFSNFWKFTDISILKNIGNIINLITMPWYIYSIVSLSDGFTILPEANSLKIRKAYRYSRHPLYLTYIIWIIAQNFIFQSLAVMIISVVQILLLLIRAKYEEEILLETFEEYKEYKETVCWIGRRRNEKM